MPVCSVAPSSTSSATSSPMRSITSLGASGSWRGSGRFGVDEGVDPLERHRGVAERARHLLVDLGDHHAGAVDRGARGVARGAQRAQAVAIGRRQLHQRDVERDRAAGEQRRDVGQEHRHEVGAALGDRDPGVGADEERHRAQPRRHRGREQRGGADRVQVVDAHAGQIGARDQRVDQRGRGGGGALQEHVGARGEGGDGLGGGAAAGRPSGRGHGRHPAGTVTREQPRQRSPGPRPRRRSRASC
jgi:hypothetical protein